MLASRMERTVHDILENSNCIYKEEYTFDDLRTKRGIPLRFDFCVLDDCLDVDFLIECQGEQHYHPVKIFGGSKGLRKQRYNDARKRAYCRKHNYPLVEIPYYEADKITYDYIMKAAGY